MTVEDLKTLFDYSYWANAGLRDVLSQVALLLSTVGHAPGNFDILLYSARRSPVAPQ